MISSATTRVPGYCALCRSRCGSVSLVEDGRLVGVEPLAGHPTGGALCAKDRAAPELAHSPRRLTRPLKRTRARSDGEAGWVEISWDQALSEIAARLAAIRAEHGAEAVAFAVTTPSGTPMVDRIEWVARFVRCFGSPNLIYAVEVCGWHRDYAHALTFGRGIGLPDHDHAEAMVLWGHNPARTWLAQAARVAAARREPRAVAGPRHVARRRGRGRPRAASRVPHRPMRNLRHAHRGRRGGASRPFEGDETQCLTCQAVPLSELTLSL